MAEIQFTKTDMLMAIDAAIGQLVTIRTLVLQMIPEGADGAVIREDVRADPHEGHQTIAGGFGEPRWCLDCDMPVGVSD